jgi:hypothetical protein
MKRARGAWVRNLGLATGLLIGWVWSQATIPLVFGGEISSTAGQTASRSFRYQDGKSLERVPDIRTHRSEVDGVRGKAYVYATFVMTPINPVPHRDGHPQATQIVTVGELRGGVFYPAVRFGMRDGKGVPGEQSQLVPWASDGRLDYYGGYARPDTPYDFKLKLDLRAGHVDVSSSGRGDDDWFLLVEEAPLISGKKARWITRRLK